MGRKFLRERKADRHFELHVLHAGVINAAFNFVAAEIHPRALAVPPSRPLGSRRYYKGKIEVNEHNDCSVATAVD